MTTGPGQGELGLLPLTPGGRRGRRGPRSRRLAWRALVLFVIPAGLAILAVAGGLATYRSAEAATGHGTKGYFVCVRQAEGMFRLPDGRISRQHVMFADPPPALRPGAVIPALDTGDATYVFARHGSRHWVTNAVLVTLVVAASGAWAWFVPLGARRRRRAITAAPPAAAGAAGPVRPRTVRPSLRGYLRQHPGLLVGIGVAAMAGIAAISVKRLVHARASVHASWPLAVGAGLAASLALLGVMAGAVWLAARQRHVTSSPVVTGLIIGPGLAFLAGMVYTRPAVMPQIGPPETVTTAFQLGAIAFMIPAYSTLAVFLAWLWLKSARSRLRVPGLAALAGDRALLTGIIRPARRGWIVTWVAHGRSPGRLRSATLASAAEQASDAAARLYRSRPGSSSAELQLAIVPGTYDGGPILQISGQPGNFTASETGGSRTVHGATLDDLATAGAGLSHGAQCMLVWTRPLAEVLPRLPGARLVLARAPIAWPARERREAPKAFSAGGVQPVLNDSRTPSGHF